MAASISGTCGHVIDVQNLGGIFSLSQIASRAVEATQLNPQAAIMVIAPHDLEQSEGESFSPAIASATLPSPPAPTGLSAFRATLMSTRAVIAAQYLIFRQPSSYVPLYLEYGDKADFLRPPFSSRWRARLNHFDAAIEYMSGVFHRANVPFILIFVPQQAQADIVAGHQSIRGVDPFAIDKAIGEIARKHRIIYRDLTPKFSSIKNAPDLYLNVDGHLNSEGNALIADQAEDALTKQAGIPALATCLYLTAKVVR
jgi:hypothetical protein